MLVLSIQIESKKNYKFYTRKGVPGEDHGAKRVFIDSEVSDTKCVQRIQIGDEAVKYFMSPDSAQSANVKKSLFVNLSKSKRVEAHLAAIAEGRPYSYEIID